MTKLDRFKLPRAVSWGISIVGIVVIIMFIILVTTATQDKRAVEIENCFRIIESTQGVLAAHKLLDKEYDLAEIEYKNTDYSKWIKMTPDTMPENMKELHEKRLEVSELVRSGSKLMDEYNCW